MQGKMFECLSLALDNNFAHLVSRTTESLLDLSAGADNNWWQNSEIIHCIHNVKGPDSDESQLHKQKLNVGDLGSP